MKKRRVLAGMMALTMALSLAGCGGGSPRKIGSSERRPQPTERACSGLPTAIFTE